MSEKKILNSEELAGLCAGLCGDKLAENVVTVKLGENNAVADYFVLCSADSEPHLRAVANHLERGLKEQCELHPRRIGGSPESGWVLADYASVIVHIMTSEVRARYDLESLWGDSPASGALETLKEKAPKK